MLSILALVAHYRYNNVFDAETAFSTVAILALVTHPANRVMTMIPLAIGSLASFERIEEHLLAASQRQYQKDTHKLTHLPTQPAIALHNVSFNFKSSERAVLDNVSFTIPQRSFVPALVQSDPERRLSYVPFQAI